MARQKSDMRLKKLLLLLILISTEGFALDKIIKAPSGKLILDAKTGETVQVNKQLNVETIGTTSGDLTLNPTSNVNIKARLTGNPSAGYIGERKTGYGYGRGGDAGEAWTDNGSVYLEPGNWLITAIASCRQPAGESYTGPLSHGVSIYAGNNGSSLDWTNGNFAMEGNDEYMSTTIVLLVTSTGATYYNKIKCNAADGFGIDRDGYISALRLP